MKSALRHKGEVLLTILLLSLPALAQGVYSGSAQYSGAVFGAANSARSFLGYTGQDIVPWPVTIPDAGGATRPGTILYDTSYPGGTAARIARCTDRSSIPGQSNTQTVAGLGGSGVGVLFNTTDTVLHVTTGTGGDAMILFDPVNMVCAATAITKDKNQTNPGSSSSYADFGGGFFSLTDQAGIRSAAGLATVTSARRWSSTLSLRFLPEPTRWARSSPTSSTVFPPA